MGYDLSQFAIEQSRNRNEVGKRKADDIGSSLPPLPVTEPWQVTERPFDARRWVDILNLYGVDTEAQATLFLLCQHSEEGARAANTLVFKLAKGTWIENPSAFVMSGAIRAYNRVQDACGEGRALWQPKFDDRDADDEAWGDWRADSTGASSSA